MRKIKSLLIAVLFTIPVLLIAQRAPDLQTAAIQLVDPYILYDPSYVILKYPNGDVAKDRGVCTDAIIRAYREIGIDLQELVHNDKKNNFDSYPNPWKRTAADRNIDHRRVLNLNYFFKKWGKSKPITKNKKDYDPGDIVVWDLGYGVYHIGIIVEINNKKLIFHNIGRGQIIEDYLFEAKIIGHYEYK